MHGAWRSLVAHLLWEQGVVGSNPAAPIISAVGAGAILVRVDRNLGCRGELLGDLSPRA